MSYDNSGVLFKNEKRTKDTQPWYRGTATIDGVEYEVAGWVKEGKKGKFMSLAFKKTGEDNRPSEDNVPY